jgi:hypothetical protein
MTITTTTTTTTIVVTVVINVVVTTVEDRAFYVCDNLTSVTYFGSTDSAPDSWPYNKPITKIPSFIFSVDGRTITGINGVVGVFPIIPTTVTTIAASAFTGKFALTGKLTIPKSVTTIGDSAFKGCTGLIGALTIPKTVTSVGASAFEDCNKFTAITYSRTTTVGTNAFKNTLAVGKVPKILGLIGFYRGKIVR